MVGSGRPMSRAVTTACTPGRPRALSRVDRHDPAVRDGAAQDRRVPLPGAVEIGDELAAAAQKAQILDPFDSGCRYRCSSCALG